MYIFALSLHLLAATVWTGGHLVLTLSVLPKVLKNSDVDLLRQFEVLYERVGMPALLVQVVTGLYLAWRADSTVWNWISFEGHSGSHIGLKLTLLMITVAFALHAKIRVIPKLSASNLKLMGFHIIAVTILSVLFVLVGVSFRTGGFLIS